MYNIQTVCASSADNTVERNTIISEKYRQNFNVSTSTKSPTKKLRSKRREILPVFFRYDCTLSPSCSKLQYGTNKYISASFVK